MSLNELISPLRDAEAKRFWGSFELTYRDEEITVVHKSETLKTKGAPNASNR